jgi:uncharacterized membrane protein YbaN (DUF454 family)
MRKVIVKILVTIVGYVLLILGIIGLFLPVLQGILMILAGLTLLSTEYHWPARIINKFKEHFEKAKAEKARKKREKELRKIIKNSSEGLKTAHQDNKNSGDQLIK